MRNKSSSILILLFLTILLAACAPATSQPAGVSVVANLTVVNGEPETGANPEPSPQPTPVPAAAENPQPLALGRVNEQGLNLRAGPSINHVIFGQLGEGTELEIQGRSENLEWLLVRLPDGKEGWVYFTYVDTQAVIASLPLKEAYGGPESYPSSAPQDARLPLNVQVSIENDLAIANIAGFPGESKVIARLGDLYVGESVTTANGNAVIRFSMPSVTSDEMNLLVSTASGDESVNVKIQYFHD